MSFNCRDCQKIHNTAMAERAVYETKLEAKDADSAKLTAQLPDDMKHCTTRFKACAVGHGWLTADNWASIECPSCKIAALQEALESAGTAMTFSARDHALNHRDAWVYGILIGWGDALWEVADKHNWDIDTVARLIRLREAVEATK